jgi:acyl-CoA thioesterase
MTADADPDAGAGRAGEHARGGLSELLGLLDLEGIDTDLFRSRAAVVPGHRLFGGQVAAQALVAAERTAAGGTRAHSRQGLGGIFRRDGTLIATVAQEGIAHTGQPRP